MTSHDSPRDDDPSPAGPTSAGPGSPAETFAHKTSGRARTAFTGVLWSALTTVLPVAAGGIVFLLASRVVTPTEFGFVAFAVAIVGIVAAIGPAGFGDALIQQPEVRAAHLNATFWLCLLSGIVLYCGLSVLASPLAGAFGEPMLGMLLPVVGIRIIFDLLAVVPTALLSRQMRFREAAMRTLTSSLLSMTVSLLVLYAGYGFWALVMSQLVTSVVTCVVGWSIVGWRPRMSFSRAALRDLARFGAYASGSKLVTLITLDQLTIGWLMGSRALGLYSFAFRIYQLLNSVLTGALSSVSYPLLASMQNEAAKLREVYLLSTFLSSLLCFPMFAGLALVADDAVPLLFGSQWVSAVPILRSVCLIGLLACVGVLQATLIRAKGKISWWLWYQVAQQVLSAVTVLLFFGQGITAVAIALTVKTWLVWPVTTVMATRLIELPMRTYLAQFLTPLAGCLLMAVGVFAAKELGDGWTAFGAQVVAGMAAYVVVVLPLSYRRLREIRGILAKRRS